MKLFLFPNRRGILTSQRTPIIHSHTLLTAVELVHELAEYLSRRYPNDFQIVRHDHISGASESAGAFSGWGWEDQPPVKTISITSLGVSFELPLSVADGDRAPERALEIAGLLYVPCIFDLASSLILLSAFLEFRMTSH